MGDDSVSLAKTFAKLAAALGVKRAGAESRAAGEELPKSEDGDDQAQVPSAVLPAADGDTGDETVADAKRIALAQLAGELDAARIMIEQSTRRIAEKDREIDVLVGVINMQKIEITRLLELLAEAKATMNLLERIPSNCN